jgi:predicted amidohydrolase
VNEKTIAALALRDGEYATLEETFSDATRLVSNAARQGAELLVLPETINLLHRRNPGSTLAECAMENWEGPTAQLREAAVRARVALVLPLLVRDASGLANRFFLLDRDGSLLGQPAASVPELHKPSVGKAFP